MVRWRVSGSIVGGSLAIDTISSSTLATVRRRAPPHTHLASTQPFLEPFAPPRRSLFFKQEMELTLVGLQNSGKTTLVNVVAVRASRPGRCDALTNVLLWMCAAAAADGWLL